MAKKKSTIACPVCLGDTVRGIRSREITYKGHTVIIDQPAYYCDACDEALMIGEDSILASNTFDYLRGRVDGVLPSFAVRIVREALSLSQRQASMLFGGGRNAFQKYESGGVHTSSAMSKLLTLLARHPELLDELRTPPNDILDKARNRARGKSRDALDQVDIALASLWHPICKA